jgi:hypothetical protein
VAEERQPNGDGEMGMRGENKFSFGMGVAQRIRATVNVDAHGCDEKVAARSDCCGDVDAHRAIGQHERDAHV